MQKAVYVMHLTMFTRRYLMSMVYLLERQFRNGEI